MPLEVTRPTEKAVPRRNSRQNDSFIAGPSTSETCGGWKRATTTTRSRIALNAPGLRHLQWAAKQTLAKKAAMARQGLREPCTEHMEAVWEILQEAGSKSKKWRPAAADTEESEYKTTRP